MSENALGDSPASVENSAPEPNEADATPGTSPEAASTPQPKPAPESDKIQKRFDELTWKLNEERRQRQALEQRLAQKPAEPPKPPTLEDNGFDETKYEAARLAYQEQLIEQKTAEKVTKVLAERDQKQQQEAKVKTFQERSAKFAESSPEYVEKVLQAQYLPISEKSQELIREMDIGPEVALYLVNNRKQAELIMALPEIQQAREIGRIEARLEAAKATPKVPTVSQAPPPPPKLDAADGTVSPKTTDPSGDALSDAEWVKAENKRLLSKRKAK